MWTFIGIVVMVIVFFGNDGRQKWLMIHTICSPLATVWFGMKFAGVLFDIFPGKDTTSDLIIVGTLLVYLGVCAYYYVVWINRLLSNAPETKKATD